jgi:DNA-directed RNA polymerase alpha subunit
MSEMTFRCSHCGQPLGFVASLDSAAVTMLLEDQKAMTIEMLALDARAYNSLKNAGFDTVAQVIQKTPAELLRVKNFGRKSLRLLESELRDHGLQLKEGRLQLEEGQ